MDKLKDDKKYHVKLIRLFEPEPKFIWEGLVEFHIQLRPNGDIGVLTPKPDMIPIPWAEYCQEDQDYDERNWVCEDYLMIICH